MATPDLELALRIRADLEDARKEVRGLQGELGTVRTASTSTSTGLDKVDASSRKAASALKQVSGAAKDATDSLKQEAAAVDEVDKKTKDMARNVERTTRDTLNRLRSGNTAGAAEALVQGGIRAGAVGSTIALTGLAVAIATTVKAWQQAAAEQTAYDQALITTGGHVGKTREELAAFARSLDNIDGVTTKSAAAAVAQIAASGEFAGEQFELAARAAETWRAATGASIDETVAKFRELQRDPVQALLALTEREHFLTEAQLARVRVLLEEGREQDAVTEAFRIYSDVIADRAPRMVESLSPLQTMMRDLKAEANEMWDALVGAFRGDQINATRDRMADVLETMARGFGVHLPFGTGRQAARALLARPERPDFSNVTNGDQKVDGKREAEAEKERDKWRAAAARDLERSLSEQIRMENEIKAMKAEALKLDISTEEVAKREAAIRKRYADAEAKRKRRSATKLTDAQQAERAAARELENLSRQAALLGQLEDGEQRVSEEARIRYEITEGGYRLASEAAKQELLDKARLIDATRAEHEAQAELKKKNEEAARAYERLRDELRTPAEAAVATAQAQIEALNEALRVGKIDAAQYREDLARILAGGPQMPQLDVLSNDPTGLDYERSRLDQYAEMLRSWYSTRTQIIAAGRAQGQQTEEFWRQQEEQLEREHQDRLADLQKARHQVAVTSTQSMFDSMAQIARHGAGEQSKAYQILFAISKGFAIAQAAVALAQNVAEASKTGYPWNLAAMAAAFAQGAQIASLLSSANYTGASGYKDGGKIRGPGTGTSDSVPIWASADEFMIRARSARQPGAYDFLEDFNARGMAAVYDHGRRGFASGGPISAPVSTSRPQYQAADRSVMSPNMLNQMRLYLYQDIDQLQAALFSHPASEKSMVATIGQNGNAVRAEWES